MSPPLLSKLPGSPQSSGSDDVLFLLQINEAWRGKAILNLLFRRPRLQSETLICTTEPNEKLVQIHFPLTEKKKICLAQTHKSSDRIKSALK